MLESFLHDIINIVTSSRNDNLFIMIDLRNRDLLLNKHNLLVKFILHNKRPYSSHFATQCLQVLTKSKARAGASEAHEDYGINPQAIHNLFIPFPFLLDCNKPE